MGILITLVVAVIIFYLLWLAIGFVPVPSGAPLVKNILYVVLIIVAVVWLYTTFMGGGHVPILR